MDPSIRVYPGTLPRKLCQSTIKKFGQDKNASKDPQPDYSTRKFMKITDFKNWNDTAEQFYQYVDQVTSAYFRPKRGLEEVAIPEWSDDGLVMAHYRPGDSCAMHVDGQLPHPPINFLRIATLLFFLNDVKKGGELHFPLQKTRIRPTAGTAIIFPPHHTHPHEVIKTGEDRYIMQAWIVDPTLKVTYA